MKPIWPYINTLTCVDLPNARNPQKGSDLAKKLNNDDKISNQPTIIQAIENIDKNNSIILITGSLYLYELTVTYC